MELLQDLLTRFEILRTTPYVIEFIEKNLLLLVFVGLAFGFAVLLVEIKLPLRYYWNLPVFLLRQLLEDFNLIKKTPSWGKCLDSRTQQIIPLAAVELLDADDHRAVKTTFSNRLGEYGFVITSGRYIVRAVKNHYKAPAFYNPENIQLKGTDESIAVPVVVEDHHWPQIDLQLQPISTFDTVVSLNFLLNTAMLTLSNGLLAISVFASWYGWLIARSALFALLMAVGIILLFVKVYIIEAVGSASESSTR